jgi:hypothetical protein
VYADDRKWVWDSAGDAHTVSLDPRRPCWQGERATESPPPWRAEWFRTDAETAKEAALASSTDREVDAATRQRLADLGYR